MPESPATHWSARLPWWLLLPGVCHWAFSWIGFSPTDDGWLQAVARRLLDGEVPHRDFIFVRPALSAYLQVPLTALGGDHVIWLSRLWGWLSVAAICWLWSGMVGAQGRQRLALYATAVFFTAHSFPIMAWHTIDGLLLCTIAVWLARAKKLGPAFFLVGCAALCRQNFAFFAPLLLVAVGGPWPAWIAAGAWTIAPALIYGALITLAGGGPDLLLQVTATGGQLRAAAVDALISHPWWWGGLATGVALAWTRRRSAGTAAALWLVLGFLLAGALASTPLKFHLGAFALLGIMMTAGLGTGSRLLAVSVPALAWVAMISVGYNNPALMAGPLFLLGWRFLAADLPDQVARRVFIGTLALLVVTGLALTRMRLTHPYRDRSAPQLEWEAGDALPGAAGLRTNNLTIATLADLRRLAIERTERGTPYAILTDLSAHWIRSAQPNPLDADWPQETELGYSPALFDRFFRRMAALPPATEIIVQKFLVSDYSLGLRDVPPRWNYYFAQNYVRANCRKVGETQFFEIYAKPDIYPPVAGPDRRN